MSMLRDTYLLEKVLPTEERVMARQEADRVVAGLAVATYREDTSICEIGCRGGDLLSQLASRLSIAQRAGRFVGVEQHDADLSRAEGQLRPWLSEHEINLHAVIPTGRAPASVVIINEADKVVSDSLRRQALELAKATLIPGGVLIHLCPKSISSATVLAESFPRVETLMAWRDFVVIAAWNALAD